MEMIESAKCECCGLDEECTHEYIMDIKANFGGKWLCGLCSEAVRDEISKLGKDKLGEKASLEEAVSFYHVLFNSNPAISVAHGMTQILRKRSTISKT